MRWLLRLTLLVLAQALLTPTSRADPADPTDPRVRALATSLGNNPTTIFQYVRDNIGIEVDRKSVV